MIIDNMKVIHGSEMMDLLKSEKNKLFTRIQSQILDDSNFTNGTIFDEILKINAEMTKHLKTRIDLRTDSCISEETDAKASSADQAKRQEEKIEKYILDFINLRGDNDRQLDLHRKALDQMLAKRIADLDIRLGVNVDDMK